MLGRDKDEQSPGRVLAVIVQHPLLWPDLSGLCVVGSCQTLKLF